MPAFAISGAGGFPPPTSTEFPEFLQWQTEGTDLGLPDVDTVNVTGAGVTTTRGTGANANTVTLNITGGGGGGSTPVYYATLDAPGSSPMDGSLISNWNVTEVIASADFSWNGENFSILTAGTYEIVVRGIFGYASGSAFAASAIVYGSSMDGFQTKHGFTNRVDSTPPNFNQIIWSDSGIVISTPDVPYPFTIALYASTYSGGSLNVFSNATILARKISDHTEEL